VKGWGNAGDGLLTGKRDGGQALCRKRLQQTWGGKREILIIKSKESLRTPWKICVRRGRIHVDDAPVLSASKLYQRASCSNGFPGAKGRNSSGRGGARLLSLSRSPLN